MSHFSFILPIIKGQKERVIDHFNQVQHCTSEDPNLAEVQNDFYKMMGIQSWERQTFQMNGQDYLLETVKGDSLQNIFFRFHYFVMLKLPIAMGMYQIYKHCTGIDFLLESLFPKVSLLFEKSSSNDTLSNAVYSEAFVLPIEPSKVALLESSLEQIKDSFKLASGIENVSVFHQEISPKQHLVIVQASMSKKCAVNFEILQLSDAELKNIFNDASLHLPVTFESSKAKMLL